MRCFAKRVEKEVVLTQRLLADVAFFCFRSTLISATTAVRNDYMLKNFKMTMHTQNIILYGCGVFLNVSAFMLVPPWLTHTKAGLGFFDVSVSTSLLQVYYKFTTSLLQVYCKFTTSLQLTNAPMLDQSSCSFSPSRFCFFFQGYDSTPAKLVVVFNAFIGIAISAVFK